MAAPQRKHAKPIQVRIPSGGLRNPPRTPRGPRIATVPGTTMVKTAVFKIGQIVRRMVQLRAQDTRDNVTVILETAEEHQDAASLFPRGFGSPGLVSNT